MLRHKTAKILIITIAAGLILLAGCGTLDMKLETDITSSGNYTQKVIITATGAIGESLVAEGGSEEMTAEGWEVNQTLSGDTVTLTASKDFSQEDPFFLPDATGTGADSPVLDIQRQNYFLFTNYSFIVNIPSDPEALGLEATVGEYDDLTLGMLKNMFTMSWTVNMPGEITSSNAEVVSGSSATWNFDVDTLSQGGMMTAEVRVIHWAVVAGLAAFVLILAIASLMFFRRRR
jgi:hypothetical protein